MLLRRRLAATIITMLTVAGCSGHRSTAAGRRTAVGATLGAIAGGVAGAAIDKSDVHGPLIEVAIGAAIDGGSAALFTGSSRSWRRRSSASARRDRQWSSASVTTRSRSRSATGSRSTSRARRSVPDFLPTIEHGSPWCWPRTTPPGCAWLVTPTRSGPTATTPAFPGAGGRGARRARGVWGGSGAEPGRGPRRGRTPNEQRQQGRTCRQPAGGDPDHLDRLIRRPGLPTRMPRSSGGDLPQHRCIVTGRSGEDEPVPDRILIR